MTQLLCQYCGGFAELVDSAELYGRSYGPVYYCRGCGAYVGCHRGTTKPLGTLANAETRAARKRAHSAFDPIWQTGQLKRGEAYRRLAEKLEVSSVHIGESNSELCAKICEASEEIKRELNQTNEETKWAT